MDAYITTQRAVKQREHAGHSTTKSTKERVRKIPLCCSIGLNRLRNKNTNATQHRSIQRSVYVGALASLQYWAQ